MSCRKCRVNNDTLLDIVTYLNLTLSTFNIEETGLRARRIDRSAFRAVKKIFDINNVFTVNCNSDKYNEIANEALEGFIADMIRNNPYKYQHLFAVPKRVCGVRIPDPKTRIWHLVTPNGRGIFSILERGRQVLALTNESAVPVVVMPLHKNALVHVARVLTVGTNDFDKVRRQIEMLPSIKNRRAEDLRKLVEFQLNLIREYVGEVYHRPILIPLSAETNGQNVEVKISIPINTT